MSPFLEENVAHFQFLETSLFLDVYVEAIQAHSWFSNQFHRITYAHYLHCHGEDVAGKSVTVSGKHMPLYIFLYSDSVTFLSFVFVLQKKKK